MDEISLKVFVCNFVAIDPLGDDLISTIKM